jgi:hypothetical protein
VATKLMLAVADEDNHGSMVVWVQESFERVINGIFPVQAPSSAAESRNNQLFTHIDGSPCLIHPGNVFYIKGESDVDTAPEW